jgi:hypothetical protein
MNDEVERIEKETIVACFNILSGSSLKENHGKRLSV